MENVASFAFRAALLALSIVALPSAVPGDAAPDPLALLARAKEAAGGEAWNRVRTLHMTIRMEVGGLKGRAESWTDLRAGRFADRYELGPASGANGFDGRAAWEQDASGQVRSRDSADEREETVNEAYRRSYAYWFPERREATLDYAGEKSEDGRRFHVVRIVPKGGRPLRALDRCRDVSLRSGRREDGDPDPDRFSFRLPTRGRAAGALRLPLDQSQPPLRPDRQRREDRRQLPGRRRRLRRSSAPGLRLRDRGGQELDHGPVRARQQPHLSRREVERTRPLPAALRHRRRQRHHAGDRPGARRQARGNARREGRRREIGGRRSRQARARPDRRRHDRAAALRRFRPRATRAGRRRSDAGPRGLRGLQAFRRPDRLRAKASDPDRPVRVPRGGPRRGDPVPLRRAHASGRWLG